MKKTIHLLLIPLLLLLFTGCSRHLNVTQTPDDVYYSPVDPGPEKKRRQEPEQLSSSDRQLRMSRYDRRWRSFDDDFNFRYDPYRYGYAYGYYYNPWYYPYPVYQYFSPVINPKNTTPRMTNLGSYQYREVNVSDPKSGPVQFRSRERSYQNSNSDYRSRQVLTPGSSSGSNNTRSYQPSSSGSSSGAPVGRPARN